MNMADCRVNCLPIQACGGDDGKGILAESVAGWSSPVARRAHNPKVVGSNPTPATTLTR